jgi:hypothetical protein
MVDETRPAVRNCPVCRIAMIASKINPTNAEFDTYTCLRCDTTIAFGRDSRAFGNDAPNR